MAQVDQFMDAIAGIESAGADDPTNVTNSRTGAHGIFQVMPQNWAPWAQEAGLGPNAPKTAENQRKVARHKMTQYHDQFGSWDAAAVAWFAGPDRARRYKQGDKSVLNLSDGNTKVSEYIDRVRKTMGGSGGQDVGAVEQDAAGGEDFRPPPEEFTYDANDMMAQVFSHLSDQVAGRAPSARESIGGARVNPASARLGGRTGEGLERTGQAVLQRPMQRSGGVEDAANPLDVAEPEAPEGPDTGSPTSGRPGQGPIPEGLQANAHRGAVAARQQLGFSGEIGGIAERSTPSDHPDGNAIDLMTHDDTETGQQAAEWYRQNRDDLNVTYIIFNGKIASPRDGWAWRDYTHPSGRTDPTAMHKDHVHVSFKGGS